jgi:hypothetical protein
MKSYNMTDNSDDIRLLHDEAARLLKEKKSDEEIIIYIISKGHEWHYAETVLDNVRRDAYNKRDFWKTMFYGLGFLLAGISLAFSSKFFFTSMGVIFYGVFWGMIATGISIIVRAFIIFRK